MTFDQTQVVHDTAVIDATAMIDDSAIIGPYCVIGPNVTIGANTKLMNHVTVVQDTVIGEENRIFPYVIIGANPQDKKYNDEETILTIGHRNEIREHVTIHRGTHQGGGTTVVGDDNLLMVGSHVAHDCILGNKLVIANQVMLAGHITVEDNAIIGGGAGINQFSNIGRCAYVGGLARITKDVPPYMIVEGTPAEARAVNVVAMARLGYPEVEIDAMKEAFRKLFKENGGAFSERMEFILQEYGMFDCIQHLCKSLTASSSGRHGRSNEKVK